MNERRNEAVDIGASRLDFDKNAASEEEIRAYEAGVHDSRERSEHVDYLREQVSDAEKMAKELEELLRTNQERIAELRAFAPAEVVARHDLHDALQAGNHDDVVSLVEQMAEIKAAELVVPVEKRLTSWIDDAVKRHAASAGAGALASFLLSSVVTAAATAKPPTIRQRLLNSIVAAIES